jgi:hypothetical protein
VPQHPEVTAKDKVRIGCVLLAHRDAQRQPAQPRTGKKAEQARIADECNARASTRRQNRHRACCGL